MTLNKCEDYKFLHSVKIKGTAFYWAMNVNKPVFYFNGGFAFHKSFLGWFLSGWLRFFSNYASWGMVALPRK